MHQNIPHFFFDQEDYHLLEIVDDALKKEQENNVLFRPYLHPHGIKTLISSNKLRIASAVINLISSLEKGQVSDRLLALRSLYEEVLSSSGNMRRNTARVLIQIMKKLLRTKKQGHTIERLKLAHDFRRVATGKPKIVLAQLERYDLTEMPEEWNQISFDDRVHDASTKGRKSPTHLIMDAWIKGIRRLTVVYYHFAEIQVIEELLKAAKIMDIEIHVGIEITALYRNRFVQFIWEPQGLKKYHDYKKFLAQKDVQEFMNKGREVSTYTQQYVFGLLDIYNEKHRFSIEKDFGFLPPQIEKKELLDFVGKGQASLLHLGRLIHKISLPLIENAIKELKTNKAKEDSIKLLNEISDNDFIQGYLLPGFNPSLVHYIHPAEKDPAHMKKSVAELFNDIESFHSLNNFTLNTVNLTQADVIELLYECQGRINCIEFFSLRDLTENRFRDGEALCELEESLNKGDIISLKRIIRKNIDTFDLGDTQCDQESDEISKLYEILANIKKLANLYVHSPLQTYIGSGSTGYLSRTFDMGFVVLDTLPFRAQAKYYKKIKNNKEDCIPLHMEIHEQYTYKAKKQNLKSPRTQLGHFLRKNFAHLCHKSYQAGKTSVTPNSCGNIALLGSQANSNNDSIRKEIPSFGYLNTTMRNWLKVIIGLIPAFLTFFLTKDWWVLAYLGAFIWFGITGVRNIIQSVVGGGGARRVRSLSMLHWHHYVNWSRVADSLLFTGFSVPLLDFLCKTVFLDQYLGITTTTSPILLYSIMGVTNGLYISGHNLLRGLPKKAAFWNLFRSILSIPVALLFNWVIGLFLGLCGIIAVELILQKWAAVISKLASDCVAGIIEGNADRGENIRMRLWDYTEKISQSQQLYALIESLFPNRTVLKMMADPENFLQELSSQKKNYDRALVLDSLDFMTFWSYQPRAVTALENILKKMTQEEQCIFFLSQIVLTQERFVAQLLVEGYLGKDFSRSLTFYLSHYKSYLRGLDSILLSIGTKKHRDFCNKNMQSLLR